MDLSPSREPSLTVLKGKGGSGDTISVAFCDFLRLNTYVKIIDRWNQIPEFEEDSEEAEFWATHSLDPRLMNSAIQRQSVRESATITLRFDPQMLSRIKRLARQRYLNYQSMIKQWLSERLEEEATKLSDRHNEGTKK